MMDLTETSRTVLACESAQGVIECLGNAASQYGFDNIIVSTPSHDGPRVIGANIPDGWSDYYLENGLWRIDPAFSFVTSRRNGAMTWQMLPTDEDSGSASFLAEAKDAGLGHGIQSGVPFRGGHMSLAISSSEDLMTNIEDQFVSDAYALAALGAARLSAFSSESLQLSKREMEVVKWLCAGLKNQEIADKMNISEKTVCEFLQRISVRNDVHGRVEIVVRALMDGLADDM